MHLLEFSGVVPYNCTMKDGNKLEYREEFEKVLSGYYPAEKSLAILEDTPLLLLVGPTASGRNTLITILKETNRYHQIVSHTTRRPRENNGVMEQDGVEYWFVAEEDFLRGLQTGEYLEAAIIHGQQVSGISVAELQKAHDSGKIALDEIEIEGAATLQAMKPDAVYIFLLPPTFEIWMERLTNRGAMPQDELRRRLTSAVDEISGALTADYFQFVINNEVHEAAVAVDELANGRPADHEKQLRGRDHAEQLLIDIRLYLESN